MAPAEGEERTGDVSNVLFCNGWIPDVKRRWNSVYLLCLFRLTYACGRNNAGKTDGV